MNNATTIYSSGLSQIDQRMKKFERNLQIANGLATGVAVAGLAGTAFAAGAIHKSAKKHPTGFWAKAGEKVAAPFKYVKEKYVQHVSPKITAFFKNNSVGKFMAKAADTVATKPAKYLYKKAAELPKPVKIAAAVGAGVLGASHLYRSGQIDGGVEVGTALEKRNFLNSHLAYNVGMLNGMALVRQAHIADFADNSDKLYGQEGK